MLQEEKRLCSRKPLRPFHKCRSITLTVTVIYNRRETRQPCRKVGQPERFEQDVLHPGEEAELLLYRHVKFMKTTGRSISQVRMKWDGFLLLRSILRGVWNVGLRRGYHLFTSTGIYCFFSLLTRSCLGHAFF